MADLAESIDITPEIGYRDEVAVSITTYNLIDTTNLGETIYRLTLSGEITQAKYDDVKCTREFGIVMSKFRVDERDRNNQRGIQLSAVLGKPRSEVESYLGSRGLTARHVDWFKV